MARAYLMEPRIADRLTAIWIGGGAYPEGGFEFNMSNDNNAANVIMDSPIELWEVPSNVYMTIKVSFAVLYEKVYPYGKCGKYLVENLMRVSDMICSFSFEGLEGAALSKAAAAAQYPGGESWQLGDSPVVDLMLTDHDFLPESYSW